MDRAGRGREFCGIIVSVLLISIGLTACAGGTSTKTTECNNANTYLKTVSAQSAEINTATVSFSNGPGMRETAVAISQKLQSFLSMDSISVPTYAVPFSKANAKTQADYATVAAAVGGQTSANITVAGFQNDENAWATEVASLKKICTP